MILSKKMGKTANKVTITNREEFAPKALGNNNLEIFESMMSAMGYKKVETEEESVNVDGTE